MSDVITVSILISKLEMIYQEHGDIPVHLFDTESDADFPLRDDEIDVSLPLQYAPSYFKRVILGAL